MGKSTWQITSAARSLRAAQSSQRLTFRKTLRELALVGSVVFAYFLTRGLLRGGAEDAFEHAQQLLSLEQTLHLNAEKALQTLAIQHQWLMQTANLFYIFGHLPVLISVGLWLYIFHPPSYLRFRTAFLLSALLGLSVYVVFPVAPPRFLPGFIDTLKASGFNVDGSAVGPFYNPYAAMPSLHVGWALLAGTALWRYARFWWLKVAGALLPLLMMLSVFMTANHYILDALAGMAVVAIALFCSYAWYRWQVARRQLDAAEETPEAAPLEQEPVALPVNR